MSTPTQTYFNPKAFSNLRVTMIMTKLPSKTQPTNSFETIQIANATAISAGTRGGQESTVKAVDLSKFHDPLTCMMGDVFCH